MKSKRTLARWSAITAALLSLPVGAFAADTDSDGLDDAVETGTGVYVSPTNTGSNPGNPDTDGDGVPDGLEVKEKTSPLDATKFNSFSQGMVAYYPFSGNANDESGHGHHGTILGNTTPDLDRSESPAACYRFDGSNYGTNGALSTIRVADRFLQIGGDYTISGWFSSEDVSHIYQCLFNTIPHGGIVITLNDPNASGYLAYGIGSNSGGWTALYLHGSKKDYQNNTWYQFALTKSGTTYTLFVDGFLSHQTTIAASSGYADVDGFRFGSIADAPHSNPIYTEVFRGKLDDFRIYSRALSAPEIQQIHAIEDLRLLSTAASSHGLISGAGSHAVNTTATLTAIPNPGYAFTGWTGDASGTTNPLAILMDANKTIGATFAPDLSDADGDLLTAFDEATIHGTDPTKADTDGDGLNDGYELGIGRFAVVSGSRTWAQAKAHAIAQGGTLATFATEGEWNRALLSIGEAALYDIGGLWIGATDETNEGTWTWITGEPFGYANWATGQPDNLNDSDYAAVAGDLGGTAGKWYDYRNATTRDGYILETGYSTDPTDPDSDNDGLNDGAEQLAGSNPFMADTDGDGLSDSREVNLTHTNPKLADTDGDGINDAADDQDGDGLANLAEITQHGTDPLRADTDNDGLSDSAELSHPASHFALVTGSFTYAQAAADAAAKRGRVASFPDASDFTRMANKARRTTQGYLWIGLSDAATEGTWQWTDDSTGTYQHWLGGQPDGVTAENQVVIMENSTQWADAAANFAAAGYLFERVGLDPLTTDTDGDGLTDGQEVNTIHSDPTLDDTDGDGLLDGAEVNTHGSSPLKPDTDEDGLNDRVEVEVYHSNPALKDTDGDGFDDLFEVNTGFDPASVTSTPDALSSIQTAVEFRFNAANGISYSIEASTDLNEWTVIEPAIIGQGGVVTRFYSIENQPKRYFRVRKN